MYNDLFDINSFNIIQDNENYYFFRALNKHDIKDIEDGVILDENGKINKIFTDNYHYTGVPMYDKNSELSLKEVYDHIKMHHRSDTNCISFTSNANTALIYGRKYYNDKYILIKVPKSDLGKQVIQAGLYMMNEMAKLVDEQISSMELDDVTKYYLDYISYSKNNDDLEKIKLLIKEKNEEIKVDNFCNAGINYDISFTDSINYLGINEKQNFEKNKLLAKIDVLNKNLLPTVENERLIQTLGLAFSSMEIIHYGDINQDQIVEVNKEVVDIFSLLQQLPNNDLVKSLKRDLLSKLLNEDLDLNEFKFNDLNIIENEYTLDMMYDLTHGQIDYNNAINVYKKSFYLAKSKLRADNAIKNLEKIYGSDSLYVDYLKKFSGNLYGVQHEIFTNSGKSKIDLSESTGLDLSSSEISLFDFINNLSNQNLESIVLNPKDALSELLPNSSIVFNQSIDKETYYANAVIDMFDWSRFDVKSLDDDLRKRIVSKLIENGCGLIYQDLKEHNIEEKYIPGILLTKVIKDLNVDQIDLNQCFTVDELENFLGYYEVKDTKIRLRSYQAAAVKNVLNAFDDKQFTSVILPTGAGKSFVGLTIMEQFKDKKILYLAPNDEILYQLSNHIIEDIHGLKYTAFKSRKRIISETFPNLEMATYAYLTDNHEDIRNQKYDLIVFDELHRTGATEWGKNIQKLLDCQDENMRLLSLTATPQRDVDNRNMADEWALKYGYTKEEVAQHKHMSINMNLEEGIRQGFVMHPKVVNCEYNLQNGELDNLLEILSSYPDSEKKSSILKKFDELRKRVLTADREDKILKDNIKKGGKYIVFLPVNGIEDENGTQLDYKKGGQDLIEKYQKKLINDLAGYIDSDDIELHSMLGSYSKSKNQKELNDFENSESSKTKFMFVINKLNEGKHVKGVNGLIWYRPLDENSRILYQQQLGRIVYGIDPTKEFPDDERTVAIDLVNNTYRVNIERKNRIVTSDIDKLKVVIDWMNLHGGRFPDIDSDNRQEARYASILKRIKEQYIKYIEDVNLIDNENNSEEVRAILSLGVSIDLWNIDLPPRTKFAEANFLDEDVEVFGVTGILRDLYDLVDEIQELGLSFEEKLEEFCKVDLKKGDKTKFSDGSAKMYDWAYPNKDKILDYAKQGNEYAIKIVEKFGWDKEQLSFEERLEEFCKVNPNSTDKTKFSDGSAIMYNWFIKNKNEILNYAEQGNEHAIKIVENFGLDKEQLSFEERLEEFCKVNPNSTDEIKFSDGSAKMYKWIERDRDKILDYAKQGNEYAIKIVEKFGWDKEQLSFEERLEEFCKVNPNSTDGIKFSDGSVAMYYWVKKNKNEILNYAKQGNEYAIKIVERFKWIIDEEQLFLNRLEEFCKVNPNSTDEIKFSDGSAKMYKWVVGKNKDKILDYAKQGDEYAIKIVERFNWLIDEEQLFLNRLEEFCKVNPNSTDEIKFSDGSAKMYKWVGTNKDKILDYAKQGNEYAIKIVEKFGWNKKNVKNVSSLINNDNIKSR